MTHPDKVMHVNIRFPLGFSLIVFVCLASLTILFWLVAQGFRATLMFFAVGAAAGAQITTAFFTARLLGMHIENRDADNERERLANEREERRAKREEAHDLFVLRREALRFGEKWNDPGFAQARQTMQEIRKLREDTKELENFICKNEIDVFHVVNLVEEMATCCRHEVVDSDLMKRQFDFVVFNTWECLSEWIKKERKKVGNSEIWEDLEWLYHTWKAP
jgi:hypothetical protein